MTSCQYSSTCTHVHSVYSVNALSWFLFHHDWREPSTGARALRAGRADGAGLRMVDAKQWWWLAMSYRPLRPLHLWQLAMRGLVLSAGPHGCGARPWQCWASPTI